MVGVIDDDGLQVLFAGGHHHRLEVVGEHLLQCRACILGCQHGVAAEVAAQGALDALDGIDGCGDFRDEAVVERHIVGFQVGGHRLCCLLAVACAIHRVADGEDVVCVVIDRVEAVPGLHGINGILVASFLPQVAWLAYLGCPHLVGDVGAALDDLLYAVAVTGKGLAGARVLELLGVGIAAVVTVGPGVLQVRGILGQEVCHLHAILHPVGQVGVGHGSLILFEVHISYSLGDSLLVVLLIASGEGGQAHSQQGHQKYVLLHSSLFF